LTNKVGGEKALAILFSEMDCDSDYDDSVVFKHAEINRIVARFNLSSEEDVQFRKRMEELELKAKADPGSAASGNPAFSCLQHPR